MTNEELIEKVRVIAINCNWRAISISNLYTMDWNGRKLDDRVSIVITDIYQHVRNSEVLPWFFIKHPLFEKKYYTHLYLTSDNKVACNLDERFTVPYNDSMKMLLVIEGPV